MEKKKAKGGSVKAVPEGFATVTPYLIARNASELIDFLKTGFDGKETFMFKNPNNDSIMHATVKIGNSTIMISDAMEGMEPQAAMLFLYVEDVDDVYQQALDADATSVREPKDEFYGDRTAAVKDKWDNTWWIATHVEDVDREELSRRAEKASKESKEEHDEVHAK